MNAIPQILFHASTLAALAGLPRSIHEWLALVGRTHVIVIHFPIALLLMAALGVVWERWRGRPAGWTGASLICGAMGAAVAMALGWMLILFNGYDASTTLTLHQYFGTATAIVAIAAAVAHLKFTNKRRPLWTTLLILLAAGMVAVTGHLGGTLVHGSLLTP